MKYLKTTLLSMMFSIVGIVSIYAQTSDSMASANTSSTTSTMTTSADTRMINGIDNNYVWVGLVAAVIIIVTTIGIVRRNRSQNNTGSRKGPESDGGISNPAGGI